MATDPERMVFVSSTSSDPAARTARLRAGAGAYVAWFWALFAVSVTHRFLASLPTFEETVIHVYNPGSVSEAFALWFRVYGDSSQLGLSQDILFSALAAALFAIVGRKARLLLLLALCLFLSANVAHVRYNLTNIDLSTARYAADPTFVHGMLDLAFLGVVALLVSIALPVALGFRSARARAFAGPFIPMALAVALLAAPPPSFVQPGWLQTHPLLPDPISGRATVDPSDAPAETFAYLPPPPAVPGGYNLLVVYLEGLSGHSIAAGEMRGLAGLAERNLSFDRYYGAQLITANGLHTSLTGDLPNFVSSDLRWNSLAADSEIARNALPNRLKDAGYHTAFLQSSPLGYMSKDAVLPKLGFETVLGRSAWTHAYSVDGWGIDDRALFEHALEYIGGLDGSRPWFVSILTTGTHPPYNVPADYMPDTPRGRGVALRYLDDAITELVAALDAREILETTVVVITSDEGRERVTDGTLEGQVALNWLPMIVLHPSRKSARSDTSIPAQRFPAMVLSLLDPAHTPGETDPRGTGKVVFGNTYADRLYIFDPEARTLLACVTTGFTCAEFTGVTDPVTASDAEPARVVRMPAIEAHVRGREGMD
jgi:hypothetical protein